MKKLGKLSINPEKVIKNEELVNLKGGGDGYLIQCTGGLKEYYCECLDSVGAWVACYSSLSAAETYGRSWCASGFVSCQETNL